MTRNRKSARRPTTSGCSAAEGDCRAAYGLIKEIMHFRRFTVMGLEQVRVQWSLVCRRSTCGSCIHIGGADACDSRRAYRDG